ncbi:hypothetical protein TNCV_2358231 [Trichonephila clavipes]|nr:hypothetical protein TNCV_2358231 [Trichonephila clavipes]
MKLKKCVSFIVVFLRVGANQRIAVKYICTLVSWRGTQQPAIFSSCSDIPLLCAILFDDRSQLSGGLWKGKCSGWGSLWILPNFAFRVSFRSERNALTHRAT